jgi:hypothetical protein
MRQKINCLKSLFMATRGPMICKVEAARLFPAENQAGGVRSGIKTGLASNW